MLTLASWGLILVVFLTLASGLMGMGFWTQSGKTLEQRYATRKGIRRTTNFNRDETVDIIKNTEAEPLMPEKGASA